MFWNFRIIRRKIMGKDLFQMHRVFYRDSMKRQATLIESAPANIMGVEPLALLEDIERMCDSFEKDVIYVPKWNQGETNE